MKRRYLVHVALLAVLLILRTSEAHAENSVARNSADYVVLLHGLGRTSTSMKRLEWDLENEGYRVINLPYPSTRLSIEEVAANWLPNMISERASDSRARIHFVCHSLGGIVLRQYLSNTRPVNLGRVVMLAPPNRGSEIADRLKPRSLYRFFTGPAGQQLGTDAESLPRRLPAADFDLGIIAGDRSFNPWFSAWIPGADDGKVSVHSARLEGQCDFVVLHHTHTWMAWKKDTSHAVIRFLKDGSFGRRAG